MFTAVIYCTESVAFPQFLNNLISTQSPRTIIQATVNTIQSSDIKNKEIRKQLHNFFASLDKIFNFQLGKILLATASSSQLKAMLAKDWPYFVKYSVEIKQCLSGVSCQGVVDLVETLGNVLNIFRYVPMYL